MKKMKTNYRGEIFQSEPEARWAIFFKALCIKYQYLGEGLSFYLPDCGYHVYIGDIVPLWVRDMIEDGEAENIIVLPEVFKAERHLHYFPAIHSTNKGFKCDMVAFLYNERTGVGFVQDDYTEGCGHDSSEIFMLMERVYTKTSYQLNEERINAGFKAYSYKPSGEERELTREELLSMSAESIMNEPVELYNAYDIAQNVQFRKTEYLECLR